MNYYEFLKSVHVLMAVVWVGGAIAIQILAFRILRENDAMRLATFSRDAGFLGQKVFAPASGILALAGVLMVIDAWDFSDTWIMIGIAGFLATVVTGLFYLTPTANKMAEEIEQKGPTDPSVQSLIKRLVSISRVDAIVLSIVVLNMVIKPGL